MDEKQKNESMIEFNITYDEYNNTDFTYIIYDNDRKLFLKIFLGIYTISIVISVVLYLIIVYYYLIDEKDYNEKIILQIKDKEDETLKSEQDNLIINDDNLSTKIKQNFEKEVENKNENNYSLCKFCGFFYYSITKPLVKEKKSNCKRFLLGTKDCFLLIFKSFLECFDKTFCSVINLIFCCEKPKCRCCSCNFPGCDENNFNKISENFCFFYKEKRKYKWFRDYITSEVQQKITPYLLEYFLLGIITFSSYKDFNNIKIVAKKREQKEIQDITFDDFIESFNSSKKYIFIFYPFVLFLMFSMKFGMPEKNDTKKDKIKSNLYLLSHSIFNELHIILIINSIISLIFSILYFSDITDFDDFILIPISFHQFFYFSLNYYCLCISEQQNNDEYIFSGSILVAIYIKIWNTIYNILKNSIDNKRFIFIFQFSLSIFVIAVFIYYLLCSTKNFKYIICENCINCNLFSCCQNICDCCTCCIYNVYCIDGNQYCDCCCCDEDCECCYSEQCEKSCFSCDCCSEFSKNKRNWIYQKNILNSFLKLKKLLIIIYIN